MTIHLYLCVPFAERALAGELGAKWCPLERRWYCTTTLYRSRAFKRWRSKKSWRRITIHPDSTKVGIREAKSRGCLWDPLARVWYVDVTGDDTLKSWHRVRLTPAPAHELQVKYEEKEAAKEHGALWDPQIKSWVVRSRAPLDEWARLRMKNPGGASPAAL